MEWEAHSDVFDTCETFLVLNLQVVSQAPQHFISSICKPLVVVALLASLSTWSFPFIPASPGQSAVIILYSLESLTEEMNFEFSFESLEQHKLDSVHKPQPF